MKFENIIWEKDIIQIKQYKTTEPLTLPLTAPIGNALLEYIRSIERKSAAGSSYIFLRSQGIEAGITSKIVYDATSRIMRKSDVRVEGGRRGGHLFRHNLASLMINNNIPRVIVSATLGHTSPTSLDYYIDSNEMLLKECALSIRKFPINDDILKL